MASSFFAPPSPSSSSSPTDASDAEEEEEFHPHPPFPEQPNQISSKQIDVPGGFALHICNHQPSLTAVLRAIKRSEHSLFNCVASIIHDYESFIRPILHLFTPFPVAANLRCGVWYVPNPTATAYFKSTDGHHGQWSFSTARLNIHIAELAAEYGGVCIVDATRRGKSFPDALTKTVPIWAAVVNAAVGRLQNCTTTNVSHLHLPPWISKNERNHIDQRIESFVDDFFAVGGHQKLSAQTIEQLSLKPLRCSWIANTGGTDIADSTSAVDKEQYTPMVLISASIPSARHRRHLVVYDTIDTMYDYVPGAGDDEESWAQGMSPTMMWTHRELFNCPLDDTAEKEKTMEAVVRKLVGNTGVASRAKMGGGGVDGSNGNHSKWSWIQGTKVGVGACAADHHLEALTTAAEREEVAILDIRCGVLPPPESYQYYNHVPIRKGGGCKRSVLEALPACLSFVSHHISSASCQTGTKQKNVLIVSTPECVDVATAVAVACLIAMYRIVDGTALECLQGPIQWRKEEIEGVGRRRMPISVAERANSPFTRLTVRQYIAVVASQHPHLGVLSKSLSKQIFNAFIPNSMCAPPP